MRLWFEDYVQIGDEIWIASGLFNGLFKYDLFYNRAEFISYFSNEKMIGQRLFSGIVNYNKKLYFIPFYATRFFIYDLENKNLYPMSGVQKKSQLWNVCCCYGNKIVMFHNTKDCILIYDIETEKFHTIHNIKKDNDISGYYIGKGTVLNNIFYIGNSSNNIIVSIDLETLSVVALKPEDFNDVLYIVDQFEGQLLSKDSKGNIYIVNPHSLKVYTVGNICEESWISDIRDTVILVDEMLYVFSFSTPYICVFNLHSKENRIFSVGEKRQEKNLNLIRQWGYIKKVGDKVFFNSNENFLNYRMDKSGVMEMGPFSVSNKVYLQALEQAVQDDNELPALAETRYFQLKYYMIMNCCHKKIHQNHSYGKNIFRKCISV